MDRQDIENILKNKYAIIKQNCDIDNVIYYILKKKSILLQDEIVVVIFSDDNVLYEVGDILKKIEQIEINRRKGRSYVCLLSVENARKEECTFFNGKSFIHFILYDIREEAFIYDKDFFYSGSKNVKKIIDELIK